MLKKFTAFFLGPCLLLTAGGCGPVRHTEPEEASGKLQIVATLFPQYDFARQIAGDLAEVTLLLPPGTESHTYEPTPADIILIQNSDLFLYTGKYMESWAEGIVSGLDAGKTHVLDVSKDIVLIHEEEEHHHTAEEHGGHTHQFDPHIWTSPANAVLMAQNILNALIAVDPENALAYTRNAAAYTAQLEALDQDFQEMIAASTHKEIMFGGRFALYYFAEHYGLAYDSAYDSCSSETEPGARAIARIIDAMREKGIHVIYYEELSRHTVADTIAEEVGAKALLLHSCHNVTKEELAAGETYLSLMRKNYENLKEGLN